MVNILSAKNGKHCWSSRRLYEIIILKNCAIFTEYCQNKLTLKVNKSVNKAKHTYQFCQRCKTYWHEVTVCNYY